MIMGAGHNPQRLHPQIVIPWRGTPSRCAYPGDNPLRSTTVSADRNRPRSRRHIYFLLLLHIEQFAADTKADSLISYSF